MDNIYDFFDVSYSTNYKTPWRFSSDTNGYIIINKPYKPSNAPPSTVKLSMTLTAKKDMPHVYFKSYSYISQNHTGNAKIYTPTESYTNDVVGAGYTKNWSTNLSVDDVITVSVELLQTEKYDSSTLRITEILVTYPEELIGYIGTDDVSKEIKKCYIGIDGKATEIKAAYIGVNNVSKKIF